MLEPLMIMEAVNGEIKLTTVPNGATAHISPAPNIQEGDAVELYVRDVLVSTFAVPRDVVFPIILIVPKQVLLGFVEQDVDFYYALVREGNSQTSPRARYRISHS